MAAAAVHVEIPADGSLTSSDEYPLGLCDDLRRLPVFPWSFPDRDEEVDDDDEEEEEEEDDDELERFR
jgi:hypothetical protein